MTSGLHEKISTHIAENAVKKDIYLDCINCATDHVHALISLGSDQTVAKIAQLLKGESSFWINKEELGRVKFEWQDEYYAASVSESMVDAVRRYIRNQQEHHKKKTFTEECEEFLVRHRFQGCRPSASV